MSKKAIIPILLVVIILAAATIYFDLVRRGAGMKNVIHGSGTIEVTEVQISPLIAGRITELPLDEGASVKKGDLLVQLDYEELSAERESAVAAFANAQAAYDRDKNLYSSGAISKMEYDNAEASYNIAKANLDQISATIHNAVIYSPLDGTVLVRDMEPGETATPGASILTIGDLTKPWIKIYVPETQLGLVKLGQRAAITVDSYPGKKFTGQVISIANEAEFTPKTIQTKDERVKLMFAVKISLANPGQDLKPGMPADADIFTGPDND